MLKTQGAFELPHLFHVKILLHRRRRAFPKMEILSFGCGEETRQRVFPVPRQLRKGQEDLPALL